MTMSPVPVLLEKLRTILSSACEDDIGMQMQLCIKSLNIGMQMQLRIEPRSPRLLETVVTSTNLCMKKLISGMNCTN